MVDIANCKITHYPAEVLAGQARPIDKIDDDIQQLVNKMTDIMIQNKGIGLAAPQAGIGLRIFIISLDGTRENVRVFINPVIKPHGEIETHEEGCLSVPQVYTRVKRYAKCTVTATDLQGNKFTEEAEGLYARALQHENDHIEGITIADKMGPAARIAHRRQLKKLLEDHKKNAK